jgi:NAD dependent epimerase/dehydratase
MNLKNKKILVTGADGFIGSHLVEILVGMGCQVKAFVYYNSFNTWGWLDNLSKVSLNSIEVFVGDVRDSDRVNQAVLGCDVVFHLAALIAIPYSYHSPRSYVDTNITGTLNILQAARTFNIEKVLVTSTSEVYGTAQYTPIDEAHPLQGQSPYSASKIAADKIAESFHRSFDLPVVTVRPFNTYGPRQSARAVIPSIISQLLAGKKEICLGDMTPTRDFNYVLDTVNGFIKLAEAESTIGRVLNIATGKEYSVEEIAEILISAINPNAKVITDPPRLRPQNSEVYQLLGDNKLIRSLTSWEPKFDIKAGLKETIDWFRNPENLRLYKNSIYNV